MSLLKSTRFYGFLFGILMLVSCDKKEAETPPVTASEHIGISARIGNVDWESNKASARIDTGYLVINASTESKHLTFIIAGTQVGKYKVNRLTDTKVLYSDSSYSGVKYYTSDVIDTLNGYINITSIDNKKKTISGDFLLYTINDSTGHVLVMENGVINQVSYTDNIIIDTTQVDGALFDGILTTITQPDSGEVSSDAENAYDDNGVVSKVGTRYVVEYQIALNKVLRMEIEQSVGETMLHTPTPEDKSVVSFVLIENDTIIREIAVDSGNSFIVDSHNTTERKIVGSLTLTFEPFQEGANTITYQLRGNYSFVYP